MAKEIPAAMTAVEQEAEACRFLLEPGGGKVFVLVVRSDGDQVTVCRSISGETTGRDARNWLIVLEREHERVTALLHKDASKR